MNEDARRLVADLRGIPPELRKQLRPRIRAAVQPVHADAQRRASAWSERIPGAITVSSRFSGRNAGVTLRVNSKRAPHGRTYEGITGAGQFRHPVFGNRDRWVSQRTKPFLYPAVRAAGPAIEKAVAGAVDSTVRRAGFR